MIELVRDVDAWVVISICPEVIDSIEDLDPIDVIFVPSLLY